MGYYRSEKEAAGAALRQMEYELPEIPANGVELGVVVYRWEDWEGAPLYSFMNPSKGTGKDNEWIPTHPMTNGWVEWAICHTHPNDTGFSSKDKDMALGIQLFRRSLIYMVTHSGAYWYDGTLDDTKYGRNSHARFGTFWGDPYPWRLDKPLEKIR
jgi:hypothetical protein